MAKFPVYPGPVNLNPESSCVENLQLCFLVHTEELRQSDPVMFFIIVHSNSKLEMVKHLDGHICNQQIISNN